MLLLLSHKISKKMAQLYANCDFCSIQDCSLGVQKFVKVTETSLSHILEEENVGSGKKKKQKIGHKLSGHYDQELRHIFSLGEGFKHEKFNNLALDKLRKDKDNTEDLGKYRRDLMGHCLIFAGLSIN